MSAEISVVTVYHHTKLQKYFYDHFLMDYVNSQDALSVIRHQKYQSYFQYLDGDLLFSFSSFLLVMVKY